MKDRHRKIAEQTPPERAIERLRRMGNDGFTQLTALSDEQLIDLILALSWELTIVGRESYAREQVGDDASDDSFTLVIGDDALMINVNEVQHRLVQHVKYLRRKESYPKEDIVRYLISTFAETDRSYLVEKCYLNIKS
ncbi:hypothetical protein [Methylobrevis albus]|uniref:Uncharacterized protein n=1 Tax=Methylobrevis albus TaxID=2793297 RepID=A0A931I5Y5_9HYPH|nr:hypothetical protein [Methylobrevis albus]MBH0239810.1 hypothetical protein [Methylobrevis albus]